MKKLIEIQIMLNGNEEAIKRIIKELTRISEYEEVSAFNILEK